MDGSANRSIQGVLFDIDDTLVDLRAAAIAAFLELTTEELRHVDASEASVVAAAFADDKAGAYERYMAGELTFLEQREVRLQYSFGLVNAVAPAGESYQAWAATYEKTVRSYWRPFDDVLPHLAQLRAMGIPFGAVSNNLESYQRAKLEIAGLDGFDVVVGSDTAGAPKPATAPFLAGCRQLGSQPKRTLYVGDNPVNDYAGARNAGLPAILLDREAVHEDFLGLRIRDLWDLAGLISAGFDSFATDS
nr:HAD family hydrolase [Glutamicibacter soli]